MLLDPDRVASWRRAAFRFLFGDVAGRQLPWLQSVPHSVRQRREAGIVWSSGINLRTADISSNCGGISQEYFNGQRNGRLATKLRPRDGLLFLKSQGRHLFSGGRIQSATAAGKLQSIR